MNTEELYQLAPGDIVLVEMVAGVRKVEDGKVFLGTPSFRHSLYCTIADPADIVRKLNPPRRKFCKGDVVLSRTGLVMIVGKDEETGDEADPLAYLVDNEEDVGETILSNKWDELTLLCAAEDRADRKEVKREQE